MSGTFQKILKTGLGAALMTESGIRQVLGDSQLTQQARDYLVRQTQKGKEELTRVLTAELKKFFEKIDLHEEIQKALSGLTVNIEAKVRIEGLPGKKNTHHFAYRAKANKGK